MTTRTYLITFDPTDPDLDYAGVKAVIKESGAFRAWWHHIPYVFMVTSDRTAEAISELFRTQAGGARFLVTAVDLTASDGNLTELGWQWIARRADTPSTEHAS